MLGARLEKKGRGKKVERKDIGYKYSRYPKTRDKMLKPYHQAD